MLTEFKKRFTFSIINYPVVTVFSYDQEFFSFELLIHGADFITFLLSSIAYFVETTFFLRE